MRMLIGRLLLWFIDPVMEDRVQLRCVICGKPYDKHPKFGEVHARLCNGVVVYLGPIKLENAQ